MRMKFFSLCRYSITYLFYQSVIYCTFLAHRQGVSKGGIVIIRCVGGLSKIAGGTNNLSLFLVQ